MTPRLTRIDYCSWWASVVTRPVCCHCLNWSGELTEVAPARRGARSLVNLGTV